MAKPKFTKEQMLQDLRDVLYVVPYEMNRMYGHAEELALVNRASGRVTFVFDDAIGTEGVPKFDISNMEITNYMSLLYDFAFEGRLDKELENDWINILEDVYPFLFGIREWGLISNNADHFPIDSCMSVVEVAEARTSLDMGGISIDDGEVTMGAVDLKTVATLAGLDEKTVRNLANPKAKNRLVTKNVKGRSFVEPDVALEWLKNRGYQETFETDETLDRDLTKTGFWGLRDVSDFVAGHRARKDLSIVELAGLAQFDADGAEWLAALENCDIAFVQDRLVAVARVLELDVKPFVMAVLKAIQADQLTDVDLQLQSELGVKDEND